MANVSIKVNGRTHEIDCAAAMPILYVLRDELGLNGPRYGCGNEQCGACRVLVDGEPAYSCTLTAAAANGKSITTVEGIGTAEHLHPLQEAFLEFNAAQCGYCSSGILVSAFHLLEQNPDPSRAEVAAALEPHLCRCGAHNRVLDAVARAAQRLRETR